MPGQFWYSLASAPSIKGGRLQPSLVSLFSVESAGKDARSRLPLVQAAHGPARVCCELRCSRRQDPRLVCRSVSATPTNPCAFEVLTPDVCAFQSPPQPGIFTGQGSRASPSRPGAKSQSTPNRASGAPQSARLSGGPRSDGAQRLSVLFSFVAGWRKTHLTITPSVHGSWGRSSNGAARE